MKRKYMILLVAVLALAVMLFYRTNPLRHVDMFVSMYGDQIERSIVVGDGVPEDLGCLKVDIWWEEEPETAQTPATVPAPTAAAEDSKKTPAGKIDMAEFILSGWGIGSDVRYYGCYYSAQDVPMAFQYADVPLVQESEDHWTWTAQGDNSGSTHKLRDYWYYFEASF